MSDPASDNVAVQLALHGQRIQQLEKSVDSLTKSVGRLVWLLAGSSLTFAASAITMVVSTIH